MEQKLLKRDERKQDELGLEQVELGTLARGLAFPGSRPLDKARHPRPH